MQSWLMAAAGSGEQACAYIATQIATGRQKAGWDEKGAKVRLGPEIAYETLRPDTPRDRLGHARKFNENVVRGGVTFKFGW